MSVKRKEYPGFIYITYQRETYRDFEALKRVINNEMSVVATNKDVVVDFFDCNGISSSEIGIMVRLLKIFSTSSRFLRLILNPPIKKTVYSTNLQKMDKLVLYENRKEFVDQVKES